MDRTACTDEDNGDDGDCHSFRRYFPVRRPRVFSRALPKLNIPKRYNLGCIRDVESITHCNTLKDIVYDDRSRYIDRYTSDIDIVVASLSYTTYSTSSRRRRFVFFFCSICTFWLVWQVFCRKSGGNRRLHRFTSFQRDNTRNSVELVNFSTLS